MRFDQVASDELRVPDARGAGLLLGRVDAADIGQQGRLRCVAGWRRRAECVADDVIGREQRNSPAAEDCVSCTAGAVHCASSQCEDVMPGATHRRYFSARFGWSLAKDDAI